MENAEPKSYIGVDIISGPGVDKICNANELISCFGVESFDYVICTELLEHVNDWKNVISNLKGVLKPGGRIFISTRSRGFGYHGFPNDFWRYEIDDFQIIFSDFDIQCLARDIGIPGILFWGKKPKVFTEIDLSDYKLWSIIKRRKTKEISKRSLTIFLTLLPIYKKYILPFIIYPLRRFLKTKFHIERYT